MTAPNPRRLPCPRCGAPVAGDFKFCPTCAFRLREGSPLEAEERPASGGRWAQVVVALLMGLLLLGILAVGFQLFREPKPVPPTPPVRTEQVPFTVQNLLKLMVTVPPGYAGWWPAPDAAQDDLLVYVPWWSKVLEVEVTRGMYAEFLRACEEDPKNVPEWLEGFWRPVLTGDNRVLQRVWPPVLAADPLADAHALYAGEEYIDLWWSLFAEHDRARREAEGREDEPGVERPDDFHAPLPKRYGAILLVPPSWAYLTPFLELGLKLPTGTEELPVTEVSWFDATAFAEWASEQVGKELRLPFDMEWLLAANGGELAIGEAEGGPRYPWGNVVAWYACNSLNFYSEGQTPRLQPIDRPYQDVESDGRTKDGIRAMAGNAREWTRNHELMLVPKEVHGGRVVERYWKLHVPEIARMRAEAPTLGGSYLDGIQDCQTDRITRREAKVGRWIDVGFRLWTQGDPMGN